MLGVDDYDNYTLHLPFSKDLNHVFWSFAGDRLQKFYDDFKDGFKNFTLQQKNLIHFYKKRIDEILSSLQLYSGSLKSEKNTYNIVATFSNFAINDVADFIINRTNADIAIVVNLNTQGLALESQETVL